jgi:Laminin EGF domain
MHNSFKFSKFSLKIHVQNCRTYNFFCIISRLNLASLERGAEDGEGQMVRFVERCQCPYGYAGYSCEKCTEGFRRENNTLQGGLCLPCDCNGHSPMCDPFSGKCGVSR